MKGPIATITGVGLGPSTINGVAFNVYVANGRCSNTGSVISGSTNAVIGTPSSPIPVGNTNCIAFDSSNGNL